MNSNFASNFLQNENLQKGYDFFQLLLENLSDSQISILYLNISIIFFFLFLLFRGLRLWRFKNLLNRAYQINPRELQEWPNRPANLAQKVKQDFQGSVLAPVSVSCIDTVFHWTGRYLNLLQINDFVRFLTIPTKRFELTELSGNFSSRLVWKINYIFHLWEKITIKFLAFANCSF